MMKYSFNSNYKCKCGDKKVDYYSNDKYKLLLDISNKKNWENHNAEIDNLYKSVC